MWTKNNSNKDPMSDGKWSDDFVAIFQGCSLRWPYSLHHWCDRTSPDCGTPLRMEIPCRKFSWPDVFSSFQQLYQHLVDKERQEITKRYKIACQTCQFEISSHNETLIERDNNPQSGRGSALGNGGPWSGIEFIDHPLAFAGLELRPETCSHFFGPGFLNLAP